MDDKASMTLVGQVLGNLITSLFRIDRNKDGVIDNSEKALAFQNFLSQILLVFGSFNKFKAAFEVWTVAERKIFIESFAANFEMENKRLEILIERWLFTVASLVDLTIDTLREVRANEVENSFREESAPETTTNATEE